MINKFILLAVVGVFMVSCALQPSTVDEAYNKTKYTVDEYSKAEILEGQYVTISFGIDGGGGIRLRRVNGNYQLFVTTFSQLGWCFFERALDKNAGNLPLNKARSNVGTGFTHEDFYLSITKAQLEVMGTNGLDVRIYGKNRTINVELPPVYIQGFMKKAAELTKGS